VDSFRITVQFPLSADIILICLLCFKDLTALDSILVILDGRGFDFSNIDRILQLNYMPTAGGSLDFTDSAATAISRLKTELVTAKLSPF
jgi:hypothetical protein